MTRMMKQALWNTLTRMARRRALQAGVVTATVLTAFAPRCNATTHPPRLLVVIVVDQMRPDYFERFGDLYTGGLKRLWQNSASFDSVFVNYAPAETAPGHATIATGRQPRRHGVVANRWYDRKNGFAPIAATVDSSTHIVGDSLSVGRSPHHLLCDGLGDWLKASSPQSKVFSVSTLPKSAVLPGGRSADCAYWYNDADGTYCTSTYYRQDYPGWVDAFNKTRPADGYFKKGWSKLLPEEAYARSRDDDFPFENNGTKSTFPYLFNEWGVIDAQYYKLFARTPYADEVALKFAMELIDHEDVGGDDVPDLLFVSCYAADAVGHTWGPFSQELEDYYLRLDRYLAVFLEYLDERVGADRYTVALTSDHGALPIPEYLVGQGIDAGRVPQRNYTYQIQTAAREADLRSDPSHPLRVTKRWAGIIVGYDDRPLTAESRSDIAGHIAERLRELPYVKDVFTHDELATGSGSPRELFDLYRRGFHPDRGPDLYPVFNPRILFGPSYGTTHGSPYPYDRHVPLLLFGCGVRVGPHHEEPVDLADVAPTLAQLLGIAVPADVDGKVVWSALAEQR